MVEPIDVRLPLSGDSAWLGGFRWSNPEGTPTLALHGWLDNAASFAPIAPYLDGLDLVAVDLPGHGKSYHRAEGGEYTLLGHLPDLQDALDALGWQRCNLLCHSLGAALGLFLAALQPERFERVVVIDGLGPRTMRAEDAPAVATEAIAARRTTRRPRVFESADVAVERMIAARPFLAEDAVRLLAERNLEPVDNGVRWRHDPRVQLPSWQRLTEPEVCAWLALVQAPVLLVRPDQGWPFHEGSYDARKAAVRHLETVVVPGHHHVHMESPAAVAEVVRPWLVQSTP